MFKIKKFSELTGLTVRTLQYYDEIELLTPTRDNNGHRMYSAEDLIKINEIILMKNMGLSLENIITQVNNKENKSLEDSLIRQEALLKRQMGDIQNQLHQVRELIQSYDEHKTIEDEAIRQVFIEKNPFKDKINDIWNLDLSEPQTLDYLRNYSKEIHFDEYFQQLAKFQTMPYKDNRVQKIIEYKR
ncbi:putative MerR family transcriptional regulator [Tetragenococcus halophilus subsp. halophilus]|uniref:MerR family transcriptional regulator n=1 Tax=Tetragenococcus halophilus (strain DSM 20338 / JCM 20259 / NCIMB 9735 / NBRC 12172) TaxID=945021 RepID=A0AAN1SHF4_TETHN|nr:MerR family transcriptional regulator [Tetragenococcus halophilus]MCO7027049.1 MerR family transcriptional regulator [Tetragenococcus halophilus]NWO00902.1 MerR family transcriptional regulator [Tetragenococcus halophilus]RQD29195.1 MerR family transcriptional regulator [Tetragenococcus halophilus subsp. halophilus DSM 20339]WJS81337.1 MerR family transcriptional regulator [Tetragenococcus halophilus]BAK94243.1 putative MerR family transcriptional regulator [Tetragenococcus halophilus NBRC 